MAWSLKGSYVETCSCDLICPCNASFDHGATYDYCRVTLVFSIKDGEIDGTDVSGLNVAAIADTPKVMTDGNWKLGVFVDERASDEQMNKLVGVFSGQMGGPMAGLAPLVGEMLGVERAPIEVVDDGVNHSVRVGNVIDFEIKDIVPFGIETGQPVRFDGMFHPVASNLTIAEATRSKIDAFGISYEGKTGLSTSEFSLGCMTSVAAEARRPVWQLTAVRLRLGLVGLLVALAVGAWWWTAARDARDGRRAVDEPRRARLVRRRLGRDDGGDDVPVGRADGRALLADDAAALAGARPRLRRRLPLDLGARRARRLRRSRPPAGASPAACSTGTAPDAGSPRRRCSPRRSTS